MSSLEFYLITRLGSVLVLLCFLILALVVFIIIRGMDYNYGDDDEKEKIRPSLKKAVLAIVLLSLILLVTPSPREYILMKGINYLYTNDNAKQIPDKTLELINKTLDKYLKETEEIK